MLSDRDVAFCFQLWSNDVQDDMLGPFEMLLPEALLEISSCQGLAMSDVSHKYITRVPALQDLLATAWIHARPSCALQHLPKPPQICWMNIQNIRIDCNSVQTYIGMLSGRWQDDQSSVMNIHLLQVSWLAYHLQPCCPKR
jgi:hypothetical protein